MIPYYNFAMTPENEQQASLPKPPDWWHEAVRSKLPGTQLTPYQFEIFEEVSADGIHYIIRSYSGGCKMEGFSEGLIIEMSIPIPRKEEAHALTVPIANSIKDILKDYLEIKMSSQEGKSTLDTNPNFGGIITKFDRQTAMGVASMCVDHVYPDNTPGNLKYFASLMPATDEEIKKAVREIILEKYFIGMSFLDRIRFMEDPIVSGDLRSAIVKEQARISLKAVKQLAVMERGFTESDLEFLRNDTQTQKHYGDLLKSAQEVSSEQERKNIFSAFSLLEPLLKAGFLEFYQKYSEEKYGNGKP